MKLAVTAYAAAETEANFEKMVIQLGGVVNAGIKHNLFKKHRHLSQEVFNNVMLRIGRLSCKYDSDDPIIPWVLRIVILVVMEARRSEKKNILDYGKKVIRGTSNFFQGLFGHSGEQKNNENDESEDTNSPRNQRHELVRFVINGLPENCQELIALRFFAVMSFDQIAEHVKKGGLKTGLRRHRRERHAKESEKKFRKRLSNRMHRCFVECSEKMKALESYLDKLK